MSTAASSDQFNFLATGEMSDIIRNYDWARSEVGTPDKWQGALRTAVSMMLHSDFPMFLWWGPNLIQFYNDAYRPSLGENGKHPTAIGQKGKECWPEIWDTIYPLIQQVQQTKKSFFIEDQLIPIFRNGRLEDVYWTFSYSAVIGDSGEVAGVLVVCNETTKNITSLKELTISKQKLEQSEENFRNMILQAPVAMCIMTGPDHVVEIANDLMIELWGKPKEAVMNKPIFEGLPDAREQGLEKLLQDVFHTGVSFRASERPVELIRKGKVDSVYQNFVYEPYRDTDGKILGVLAITIDVTDQVLARRKIEDIVAERTVALETSNKDLQRSNAELAQFAYIASHDLQEPLRKIRTFAQMLEKSLANDDGDLSKNYLDKIQTSSKRMESLIRDVLTYSEVIKTIEWFVPVDLTAVVNDVKNDFEVAIEQKNAKVTFEKLPVIEGIQLQMAQLFSNLISNALKFSKPGVPSVIEIKASKPSKAAIAKAGLTAGKEYCLITLSDNGIGFDPEFSERIFHIFQRLHRKSEFEGTGIGLAICKKIVVNHEGSIEATGALDKGAVFKIMLPVKQG